VRRAGDAGMNLKAAYADPDSDAQRRCDARATGQQETLASRPMIVTPGLLPAGAAGQPCTARLAATGHHQPYPHAAGRPGSQSCSTAVRPP